MTDKLQLYAAKVLSIITYPLFVPTWITLGMFSLTYFRLLPSEFLDGILLYVFVYTFLIPMLGMELIRILNGWTFRDMSQRVHRTIPYILTFLSSAVCVGRLHHERQPVLVVGVVVSVCAVTLVCLLLNLRWKVSTHMAGMGGMLAALFVMQDRLTIHPLGIVCFLILLTGLVGTCRMALRQHNLMQILSGVFIGVVCTSFFLTHFSWHRWLDAIMF